LEELKEKILLFLRRRSLKYEFDVPMAPPQAQIIGKPIDVSIREKMAAIQTVKDISNARKSES
jgi:hypothetical protein